jgi:hypothetical protein
LSIDGILERKMENVRYFDTKTAKFEGLKDAFTKMGIYSLRKAFYFVDQFR